MNPYTHRFRQESLKIVGIAVMAIAMVGLVAIWRITDSNSSATIAAIDIEMATWVNGERRWNGVSTIPIDGDLASQAQLQANRMAACSCLYHSSQGELHWWLERGWFEVGENVGVTTGVGIPALFGLHLAFILSPPHRDNMLNPQHRALGLAVRQSSDGRWWIAQFYGGVPDASSYAPQQGVQTKAGWPSWP